MKLNKFLGILLLSLFCIIFINAVDLDNITFTNEEFYNGAITASKIIELSNGNIAVFYIKSTGSAYYKVCDSELTNCSNEFDLGGAQSIDMFEDTTNNKVIYVIGSTSQGLTYKSDLNGVYEGPIKSFNTGSTNYISAVQTTSTDFAIAFQDTADGNKGKVIICKLDGSSIGSETTFYSGTTENIVLKLLSNDEIAIAYELNNANGVVEFINKSTLATISGPQTFNTGATSNIDMIQGSDTDLKFVYRDEANSNQGTFNSCDDDGTNCIGEYIYNAFDSLFNLITEFDELLFISFKDEGNTGYGLTLNTDLDGSNPSSKSIFTQNQPAYMSQTFTSNNQLLISYDDNIVPKGMFAISEPLDVLEITTNVQDYYNTNNISIEVNTTQNANISYTLDNSDLIVSNGLVSYYQAEENAFDRLGLNNGTWSGTETYVNSVNNTYAKAFDFDGINSYIDNPFNDYYNTYSISFWVNTSSNTGDLVSKWSGTNDERMWSINNNNGLIRGYFRENGGSILNFEGSTTINSNQWTHVLVIYQPSGSKVYINNVDDILKGTDTYTTLQLGTENIDLGRRGDGGTYFDGSIDEVRIYNRSLSPTEITQLYETSPYINICEDCNTTTLNLTNQDDGLHNITIIAQNGDSLTTLLDAFTIDTTNPSLIVSLPTEYNSYTDFNISNYITYSDTNLDTCIVKQIYNDIQESTYACSNESVLFNYNGNYTFNVTVTDLAGNTNSSNGNVMLISPINYFQFQLANGTAITNYTFGGETWDAVANFTHYELGLGNNTLTFQKVGFLTQTFTFNLNNTNQLNNTYNISRAVISISIKDKTTLEIINTSTFNIELIGEMGFTTNTTTGRVNISDFFFTSGDYRIIVTSDDYLSEDVFFNFTNEELLELDIYVSQVNETKAGFVIIAVVDGLGQAVSGAIVQALQWDGITSQYIRTSEGLTGLDGKANLNIILDDKVYIFRATKTGLTTDSPEYRVLTSQNGLLITIALSSSVGERSYLFRNLITRVTELSYINNVSTIEFDWVDQNGISQEVCLNVFRYIGLSEVKISESCTSGVSGTYTQAFNINSSNNIRIKGQIKIGDSYYTIKSFNYPSDTSLPDMLSFLELEFIIIPLLFFISIALAIKLENIQIGTFLLVASVGWSLYLVPTLINGGIVTFLFAISWLIIWGAQHRR